MYATSLLLFLPALYCFLRTNIFLTMIDKAKLIIPQFKKTLFSDLNHVHTKQAFYTQLWAVNEKCHPSARLLTDGNLVFWYSNHIRQNVNLEDNR